MTPQPYSTQAKNRLILSKSLLALSLLLIAALGISGCVAPAPRVNVNALAGLAQASQMEIGELVLEPQAHYESRLTVTDQAVLRELSAALDADLPLEPLVDCLAQYHLRFVLAGNEELTLAYYCAGGESFLTGAQSFWAERKVTPPSEFDAIMNSLLQTLPD